MVKKLGSAGMLIGGLMAAIGGIFAFINAYSMKINAAISMAVLARVGAIITFVAAIVIIAGVVMSGTPKKGGAIAGMIFAIIAFIGQFMINPITSWRAAASAGLSGNAKAAGGTAAIGLFLLIISGFVCFIMGVVGAASKNKS